jgi:hypothetical protein
MHRFNLATQSVIGPTCLGDERRTFVRPGQIEGRQKNILFAIRRLGHGMLQE